MKLEIDTALDFLCKILQAKASPDQLDAFRRHMNDILQDRFQAHWHPEQPIAGSAYRCIRWEPGMQDRVLLTAADKSAIDIRSFFPSDLTLWIDPNDVSARIGSYGSVFSLELGKGKTAPSSPSQPPSATSPARSKSLPMQSAMDAAAGSAGDKIMAVQQDAITVSA